MDVGPSKVVVCSADTAWFYKVSTSASSSSSSSSSSTLGGRQHHRRRQYYHQQQQPDGEQQQVRQSSSADTVGNDQESDDDDEKEEKEEKKGSVPSDAHVEPQAPWGCRVLGWNVTEARFSADERRCYFGTVSGLIYSVSALFRSLLHRWWPLCPGITFYRRQAVYLLLVACRVA